MAQPIPYTRAFNFANYQTSFPFQPLPGADLDEELNRVKTTTDQIRFNLDLIQRDDGQLENRSVGYDQLAFDVLNDLGGITGLRYVEYIYDIAGGAVNEVQQIEVNLSDFNDAVTGGAGTGLGFDIRFDYLGNFYDLKDADRQTFTTADLQTNLEAAIPALAGNINVTTNLTSTGFRIWDDPLSSGMPQVIRIEFINALATTNVAPITLAFYEPGTLTPIAETPLLWSEIQVGGGAQSILSGADRNGNVLEYAGTAPISIHINGLKADPADYTAPDGTSIIYSPTFPASAVVCVQVGDSDASSTSNLTTTECIDDISGLFDGSRTSFPILVSGIQRIVFDAKSLTILIDDVRQEPIAKYDVSANGEEIVFVTAPKAGCDFWGLINRSFFFGNGSITSNFLANGSVTADKIPDNTIGPEKLNFLVNQLPVGAVCEFYDNVYPSDAPAGVYAFPVGQSIGKCGSGADLEDDDYELIFNIVKKRWNNTGSEDFDSLDIVLLPDIRGTTAVVPDKLKGKVVDDNEVGDFAGLEYLPTRRLCGTASTSGFSDDTVLTKEQINHWHAIGGCSDDGLAVARPWSGETYNLARTSSGSDSSCTSSGAPASSGAYGSGDPRMNNTQGHNHFIDRLPLDHSNLYTCTDRIMQPYVVAEKLMRLK